MSSILPCPPCLPPVMLSARGSGRKGVRAGEWVWQGCWGKGRRQGTFHPPCHILHCHMVLRPKGTSHNEQECALHNREVTARPKKLFPLWQLQSCVALSDILRCSVLQAKPNYSWNQQTFHQCPHKFWLRGKESSFALSWHCCWHPGLFRGGATSSHLSFWPRVGFHGDAPCGNSTATRKQIPGFLSEHAPSQEIDERIVATVQIHQNEPDVQVSMLWVCGFNHVIILELRCKLIVKIYWESGDQGKDVVAQHNWNKFFTWSWLFICLTLFQMFVSASFAYNKNYHQVTNNHDSDWQVTEHCHRNPGKYVVTKVQILRCIPTSFHQQKQKQLGIWRNSAYSVQMIQKFWIQEQKRICWVVRKYAWVCVWGRCWRVRRVTCQKCPGAFFTRAILEWEMPSEQHTIWVHQLHFWNHKK